MENLDQFRALGLFDSRVPRYTSYPTAPVFSPAVGSDFQAECLGRLDRARPVSVYVHIPFCERLCWFCACRTQGARTLSPVESYLVAIEAELALVAARLPRGVRMGRLHWGGGTPTILPPAMIHRLSQSLKAVIPPADEFEFSVEIDPTLVDDAKIEALRAEGMTRASIGIQDFRETVQKAIGREQSFDTTERCVRALREAGIASLNTDLVYGLPHQTVETVRTSVERVLSLAPDRVALFGYAHVPNMSKRQKLIDEAALPGGLDRYRLLCAASGILQKAGFDAVGIDHFTRREDGLAVAMRTGRLRRNFQGYTDDTCVTLLGLGASSISRFEDGFVQNAAATGAYSKRAKAGALAGYRGHRMSGADKLHARAIEMLMCDFRIDMAILEWEFPDAHEALEPVHASVSERFRGMVGREGEDLRILEAGRPLTRIIAAEYDQFRGVGATFSRAS